MSTELTYKKDDVEAFGMYQLPEADLDLYLVDSRSIYFPVCPVQAYYNNGMKTRVGHVEMSQLNVRALVA